MKTLIVLPSYNESENIIQLIQQILSLDPDIFLCVVDDSSPDGTGEKIRSALASGKFPQNRLHLILRSKKDGRGGAVRDGFSWGVKSGHPFNYFVEMDCDFSHEPQAIPIGLGFLDKGADIALGSRYPDGIIIGWPLSRRVFSFFANTLARILIKWSIPDYTNGFRFYNNQAVEVMLTNKQYYKGYIYLSESITYFLKAGLLIKHFPTRFRNRQRGTSNTTLKEIFQAFTGIFRISWRFRFS